MNMAMGAKNGPRKKSHLRGIMKTEQGFSRWKKTEQALLSERTVNAKEWKSPRERNLYEGHQGGRDGWMSGYQVSIAISKKGGRKS